MKREHNKKFKEYFKLSTIKDSIGVKIEDLCIMEKGSYGERQVDWVVIFLEDKTQIVLPVIPEYRIALRTNNKANLRKRN